MPPPTEAEKFRLEADVHKLIVSRDRKYTNFVEYQSCKLIYRRYAGLYFSLGVDVTDNELAYLESIHLFVELLDEFFRNVCELDIVFNFNKVGLWCWCWGWELGWLVGLVGLCRFSFCICVSLPMSAFVAHSTPPPPLFF